MADKREHRHVSFHLDTHVARTSIVHGCFIELHTLQQLIDIEMLNLMSQISRFLLDGVEKGHRV